MATKKANVKVEVVETGYQAIMTRKEFNKRFGFREGKEILQGYCSNIVAYLTDKPVNHDMPNFKYQE